MNNIEQKEILDYSIAVSILKGTLKEGFVNSTKLPQFSPVDMKFKAKSKSTSILDYGMEIKSVNGSIYKSLGLILKMAKFIRIKEWSKTNNNKVYLIYICVDTNEFFIYDTSKIKLDEAKLELQPYKAVQYIEDSPKVLTPIIRLYPKDALVMGTINPTTYSLSTGGNKQSTVN